ncbi:MAG: hypothetical protein J7L54_01370 [Elusimicrobia bacterium]|nr:hypothetical protein [Elusimicrobiota bacterium]
MDNLSNIILLAVIFLLSLWELIGIYNARQKGLTKNVSRLLTHSLLLVGSAIALIQIFFWENKLVEISPLAITIPFYTVMILIIFLAASELAGSLTARIKGLTKNISRIVTHFFISLAAIILLLKIT